MNGKWTITFGSLSIVNGEHRFTCSKGPGAQSFIVMFRRHGYEPATREIEDEIRGVMKLRRRLRKVNVDCDWTVIC